MYMCVCVCVCVIANGFTIEICLELLFSMHCFK